MARSYLFTPAHQPHLLARAHEREADVVLLDLEDGVPPAEKPAARAGLAEAVAALRGHGARVAIRVNAGLGDLARDVEAACLAGVETLMLPKVACPDTLRLVSDHLSQCEHAAGLPVGKIGLIALIESASGLMNATRIAAGCPRLQALAFGTEDFSTDCGIDPSPESLTVPSQTVIWAAKSAGIAALGLPGSIADVADIDSFEANVSLGRRLGFDGCLCIHPRQVAVVNRVVLPSPAALAEARRIVEASEQAVVEGRGAVLVDGRMVDPPIVARALRLLHQSQAHTGPA